MQPDCHLHLHLRWADNPYVSGTVHTKDSAPGLIMGAGESPGQKKIKQVITSFIYVFMICIFESRLIDAILKILNQVAFQAYRQNWQWFAVLLLPSGNLGSKLVEYKEEMYITSDCGKTWRQVHHVFLPDPCLSFTPPLPLHWRSICRLSAQQHLEKTLCFSLPGNGTLDTFALLHTRFLRRSITSFTLTMVGSS